MQKIYSIVRRFIFPVSLSLCLLNLKAQFNKGIDFWAAYGHHQYMEPLQGNSQNLVFYISTGDQAATVTLEIDSSGNIRGTNSTGNWWRRVYTIPANTTISTGTANASAYTTKAGAVGPMPKDPLGSYDCRLISDPPPAGNGSEGIFRGKGIHITSNVPIAVSEHIYGAVSSGATMLIPTDTWGYSYTAINSEQTASTDSYSWLFVIAKQDNTTIEITPAAISRLGKTANVPFTVTLNTGQIYQLLGQTDALGNSVELTGSKVKSIPNALGKTYPVAVFAGSSRTGGESLCGAGGRDNDIQQCFPQHTWGKNYLTAPFSSSVAVNTFQGAVYKVMVKNPATVVKLNGTILTGLINNSWYKFLSSTANYIQASEPVMVAQFMGSGCGNGSNGDPEMTYLSPQEQGIKQTAFARTTLEAITANYLTLVIPSAGVSSLKIDGSSTFSHTYAHPNKPGHSVVVKTWPSAFAQVTVTSDSAFTGISYGLGGAESYGFNIGASFGVIDSTSIILPIQLTAFGASALGRDKGVLVKWSTASETGTLGFEVERSVNNADFEKVGYAIAKGQGVSTENYEFTDAIKAVAISRGALWYRLKSIDKDGSYSYSKTVSVNLVGTIENVAVYPNPFKEKIQVSIHSITNGDAVISVSDITGKKITEQQQPVTRGVNILQLTQLQTLKSGTYILTVKVNGAASSFKLIK